MIISIVILKICLFNKPNRYLFFVAKSEPTHMALQLYNTIKFKMTSIRPISYINIDLIIAHTCWSSPWKSQPLTPYLTLISFLASCALVTIIYTCVYKYIHVIRNSGPLKSQAIDMYVCITFQSLILGSLLDRIYNICCTVIHLFGGDHRGPHVYT